MTAGKLKTLRLNPSTLLVQHDTLGTVGLLASGTEAQPGALVFYPLHPLWTAAALGDLVALMELCKVEHPLLPEFALAAAPPAEDADEVTP